MTERLDQYELLAEFASGGMARVHFGRIRRPGGFAKTVAIKRLKSEFVRDAKIVELLLQEARLTGLLHHPNIVETLDVISTKDDLFIVMEYVRGVSLDRVFAVLSKQKARVPPRVAAAILAGVLHGLHAAHRATGPDGAPLQIVHCDVSPHNVLVDVDGVARVADFGVARVRSGSRASSSIEEEPIFGKLAYLAPELALLSAPATPKSDIYAAGIVLWEALTGQRLFRRHDRAETMDAVLTYCPPPPSRIVTEIPAELDEVVLRALEREPEHRFETARDMATAIEGAISLALPSEISRWIEPLLADAIAQQTELLAQTTKVAPIRTFASTDGGTVVMAAPSSTRAGTAILASTKPAGPRLAWRLGAASLAGVTASLVLVTVIGTRARPEAVATVAEDAAAAEPLVEPEPPAPSAAASSASAAPGGAEPSGSAEAARPTPSSRPQRRPLHGSHVAPPPPAAPAALDCTKKYSVDSAGHIIFRKECL